MQPCQALFLEMDVMFGMVNIQKHLKVFLLSLVEVIVFVKMWPKMHISFFMSDVGTVLAKQLDQVAQKKPRVKN